MARKEVKPATLREIQDEFERRRKGRAGREVTPPPQPPSRPLTLQDVIESGARQNIRFASRASGIPEEELMAGREIAPVGEFFKGIPKGFAAAALMPPEQLEFLAPFPRERRAGWAEALAPRTTAEAYGQILGRLAPGMFAFGVEPPTPQELAHPLTAASMAFPPGLWATKGLPAMISLPEMGEPSVAASLRGIRPALGQVGRGVGQYGRAAVESFPYQISPEGQVMGRVPKKPVVPEELPPGLKKPISTLSTEELQRRVVKATPYKNLYEAELAKRKPQLARGQAEMAEAAQPPAPQWLDNIAPWDRPWADPKRAIENTYWQSLADSITFKDRMPDMAALAEARMLAAKSEASVRGIDLSAADKLGRSKAAESIQHLAASDAIEASRGAAAPVPAVAPRPTAKEPWQMTKAEWLKQPAKEVPIGPRPGRFAMRKPTALEHRQALFNALSEGKPVSAEVLADYPDLARLTKAPAAPARAAPPAEVVAPKVAAPTVGKKVVWKFAGEEPVEAATPQEAQRILAERKAAVRPSIIEAPPVRSGAVKGAMPPAPAPEAPPAGAAPPLAQGVVPPTQPLKPPRRPMWAMSAEEAGIRGERGQRAAFPPPPGEPPRPPTAEPPVPSAFPSGRKPGIPARAEATWQPFTPEEDLAILEEAVSPPKPTLEEQALDLGRDLKARFIDSNDPLVPLSKETGIPVHDLAQMVADAGGGGDEIVRREIVPLLQTVTKDLPSLELYMVARRNEDILARNPSARLPGGMRGWRSTLQVQKALEKRLGTQRFRAIQRVADALWEADRRYNIDLLESEGFLDARSKAAILNDNRHYIPWDRADFEDLVERGGKGGPASISETGMRRLDIEGSTRPLSKALARFVAKFSMTQESVARNRAAKALHQALVEKERLTGETLVQLVEPRAELLSAANVSGGPLPSFAKAEHSQQWEAISYFKDGKKWTVNVPAIYGRVAKGLGEEGANFLLTWGRVLGAPLRYGAVVYNPAWPIVNTIMNASSAWFREGVIPLGPDFIQGIISAARKDKLFSEVAGQGILMRGFVDSMRDMTAMKRATGQIPTLGAISLRSPKDAALIVPRLVALPFKGIAKVSVATEQATRIAAYRKLTREGVGSLERAIRAKEVTIDFSKMGTNMRTINAVIPFTNAALQGTALMTRTIWRNPKWAAIAASPFLAATVLSRVNNMRFDTSSDIPSYEYTRNWVFQFGEGTRKDGTEFPLYFKIPKGPLGSMLSFPLEAMFRVAQNNGDKSAAGIIFETAYEAAKTISPVDPNLAGVLPPVAQTGFGVSFGVDPYTRRDIVPRGEQNLLPEQQFGPETSRQAVALGKAAHISPRLIDWAIKDYTAGTGEAAMATLSLGLDAIGYQPEVFGAAGKAVPTMAEEIAAIPGVRRFYGTKATEMERRGWDKFQAVVESTNREFSNLPGVSRLGIRLGQVGDSIGKIALTPAQQAEYQQVMADIVIPGLERYLSSSGFTRFTEKSQVELAKKRLSALKDGARLKYLRQVRGVKTPAFPVQRTTATPAPGGGSRFDQLIKKPSGGTPIPAGVR